MLSLGRDDVRRIDRFAIDRLGVCSLVLMENAGRQAADALCRLLGGGCEGRRVVVVAGAGNNAGDGFVLARHAMLRGAAVRVLLVAPLDKLTDDARANLNILSALEADVCEEAIQEASGLGEAIEAFKPDALVDAIGGTGVTGALRGGLATAAGQLNAAATFGQVPVLALDIPTGLDCDTGEAKGPAVRATMTVTFAALKKGFDAPGARDFTGEVFLADIGIPAEQVLRMAGEAD